MRVDPGSSPTSVLARERQGNLTTNEIKGAKMLDFKAERRAWCRWKGD